MVKRYPLIVILLALLTACSAANHAPGAVIDLNDLQPAPSPTGSGVVPLCAAGKQGKSPARAEGLVVGMGKDG